WVVFTSRDNVYVAAVPPVQMREPAEVSIKEGPVPVWRLSGDAGGYPAWADGGKTLTWGLARTFYRLPLTRAVSFAEEQRKKAEDKAKAESAGDTAAKKDAKADAAAAKKDEDDLPLPTPQTITLDVSLPRPVPAGSFVL